MSAPLVIEDVSVRLGRTQALHAISLEVAAGTTAVLLGPSGSGKTTLLRAVMGLESPVSGSIAIAGRIVASAGTAVAAHRRGVAMVFQEFTLFPHLSVRANAAFGAPRGSRDADDALALMEVSHLADRSVERLSGGEQQRVALARALASGPDVLLLDEPFSNVDVLLRQTLRTRVRDHLRAAGITTVLATHDHEEAFSLADQLALLRDGTLVAAGSARTLYRHPRCAWSARFLGTANILTGQRVQSLFGWQVEPEAHFLVRPEGVEARATSADAGAGTVTDVSFHGPYERVQIMLDDGTTIVVHSTDPGLATGTRVALGLSSGCTPHRLEDRDPQ